MGGWFSLMDVLRFDFLFCSVNTLVTLISPVMPIYDPPHFGRPDVADRGLLLCWRHGLRCQTCMPWKRAPGCFGGSEWSREEVGRLKRRSGWPSERRIFGQVMEEQAVHGRTPRPDEDVSRLEQPRLPEKECPFHEALCFSEAASPITVLSENDYPVFLN